MSEPKGKRQRASSAKPAFERKRPSSGNSQKNNPQKNNSKVDFIENLYGGVLLTRKQSKLHSKIGMDYLDDSKLLNSNRPFREKEQLLEENTALKKEINGLKK